MERQFTIFSNTSTIKENKRQFFYMGGQFTIIFLHASSITKRGGEPAQVTINKEKVVLTQVMILCWHKSQ